MSVPAGAVHTYEVAPATVVTVNTATVDGHAFATPPTITTFVVGALFVTTIVIDAQAVLKNESSART